MDESGATTCMTRWRGRALAGQRLVASVPHGRYKTCTLIAAIGLHGALNGELFLA